LHSRNCKHNAADAALPWLDGQGAGSRGVHH
jgi:hypothetical protein